MGTEVLGLDKYPLRTFPYSESSIGFDLEKTHKLPAGTVIIRQGTINPGALEVAIGKQKKKPQQDEWEIDVKPLVATKKWLASHGLQKNKLDLYNILPRIGFPRSEKFEDSVQKPVASVYAYGLFNQIKRPDGKTFKITCNKEKLTEIEDRLLRSMQLFRRRLQWLTSGSRRLFGVISEHCVTIVLDIKNMSPKQFDSFRFVAEIVLQQQISQLAKFNIIRAAEDDVAFAPKAVPVTTEAIDNAIDWVWNLDRLATVSKTASCETVLKALEDKSVECVYLFSEGCSSEGSKQILKEKLAKSSLPVHVVSFNCHSAETVKFLKELASVTGGRFHCYGFVMEFDAYEGVEPGSEPSNGSVSIVHKTKKFGGVPPSAECREDVVLLFDELEEARNTLAQVQAILKDTPDPEQKNMKRKSTASTGVESNNVHEDHYMSSTEWLAMNGLTPKQLGFYDVLSAVAFRHCDGVVDVKSRPPVESDQRDAIKHEKLVNARYCDKFAHVAWKDGRIVHVQVTPDIHRIYEQKMIVALNQIKTRIEWLQQGSRALFGTVIEDQVYILIDTSASMEHSIQFVKDKLYLLMQEQIRHKLKFNLISFNSKVRAWRDRLVEVNEMNLHDAWSWIKGLNCSGSTNTLGALKLALNDPATQAIYILTDGRPDQQPGTVLAQVHLREAVPVHAISFNCADVDANKFLCKLAKNTNGRYHYYSELGFDTDGPEPWESEDIRLLKNELVTGEQNLARISNLRDECLALAWAKDTEFTKSSRRKSNRSSITSLPSTITKSTPRPSYSVKEPMSHADHRKKLSRSTFRYSAPSRSTKSAKSSRTSITQSLPPSQTRSSIFRAAITTGRVSDEWLLPETKEILEKQLQRQNRAMHDQMTRNTMSRKHTRLEELEARTSLSSTQWLRKRSLAAQKLTIMDVLAPTIVPHDPKYVPILDKNVVAKVFDEILPIAHVSKKKKVRLVNPSAIDLFTFEKKLQKAIDSYHKRLSDIVQRSLPKKELDNFVFPLDWEKHRLEVLTALENSNWPLKKSDISLLEEEIEQAEKYLEQSNQLRAVDRKTAETGEVESVKSEQVEKVPEKVVEDPKEDDDMAESVKETEIYKETIEGTKEEAVTTRSDVSDVASDVMSEAASDVSKNESDLSETGSEASTPDGIGSDRSVIRTWKNHFVKKSEDGGIA